MAETFGIFSDSDQELHQDLQKVNLPHLVEKFGGFDVEKDWGDVLFLEKNISLKIVTQDFKKRRFLSPFLNLLNLTYPYDVHPPSVRSMSLLKC